MIIDELNYPDCPKALKYTIYNGIVKDPIMCVMILKVCLMCNITNTLYIL